MELKQYAEERARDALQFEPLPESLWIKIDRHGILVTVPYSEQLSRLLRSIPNAKWDSAGKRWRYPFTACDAIRRIAPDIDRLASLAKEPSVTETPRRTSEQVERALTAEQERTARALSRAMAEPRPFQRRYLDTIPGRPRFVLILEAIADNLRSRYFIGMPSRCWVARLFGSDGRGGWARVFVCGARDYCRANSTGSRGIAVTYFLEEGPIYEVSSPQSWKSTDRYFLHIDAGIPTRMTAGDVHQCLAK